MILKKELHISVEMIKKEKIILYPTDTVWGIGCDATCSKAVGKIYKIKQREESKSLVILVDSLQMLQKYVENIPEKALSILKKTNQPTTIIYENAKGLAKNAIANNGTVAIRIVQNTFCKSLIQKLKKPIVSTSANISGEATPLSFSQISNSILEAVDYIVTLPTQSKNSKPSVILKIEGENIITIRS